MVKPSDGCAFIAFDWQDSGEAQALTAALERAGVAVWASGRDMAPAGDQAQYSAGLAAAASRAAAFVLLVGPRPADPQALAEQTRIADATGKPIYPVRIHEQASAPDFPALAKARTWIDATGQRRDQEIARLAAELRAFTPQPAAAPAGAWAGVPASGMAPISPAPTFGGRRPAQQSPGLRILMIVAGVVMILGGLARILSSL